MSRNLLAGGGVLLAAAGFATFITIGVGAWVAKREAGKQLDIAAGKAHQAADVAARVVELVREVIARARLSLSTARADAQPPGEITDPMVRIAMWKAKRELPGQVEKARDAVGVASEAVIVAESVLDVFIERKPDSSSFGIRSQDINTARTQLESAASDLKNARGVLGIPITATPEQYSQVEQALNTATDVTDRVSQAIADAEQKVGDTRAQADRLMRRTAIAVTALAALAAFGQIFLFRTCWLAWSRPRVPSPAELPSRS